VTTAFQRPAAQVGKKDIAEDIYDDNAIKNNILRNIITLLADASDQVSDQVSDQASDQASDQVAARVILYCKQPRSAKEIMDMLQLKHRTKFRSTHLQPLMDHGCLEMTRPDKPHSSKQRYQLTGKGRKLLAEAAGRKA